MEAMLGARRRGKHNAHHVMLWCACLLLSSLSLLLAVATSGAFGAAKAAGGHGLVAASVRRAERHAESSDGGECSSDDHRTLADGDWVRDERYPLYEAARCPFVDEGFRCRENGRPDGAYTRWRWQPRHCTLPRFDAQRLLELLRNRRVAFVGDSIGRNQWESLLCMLSEAIADKTTVYEENGNPITKHRGFLSFRFRDHNCTVQHYRAPYLVRRGRPPRGSPKHVNLTLQLDAMDSGAALWRDADVLVFNTGHWWNQKRLLGKGWYFQEGKKLRIKMGVDAAYQKAIKTLVNWIEKEVNPRKTLVVFRTYSPAHLRANGDCSLETQPELNSSRISLGQWPGMLNPSFEEPQQHPLEITARPKLQVLNITLMTAQRRDGHPSTYNLSPSSATTAAARVPDCSHWCLPGVPDVWNELLYALVLNRFQNFQV